jgi:hypothetical protein
LQRALDIPATGAVTHTFNVDYYAIFQRNPAGQFRALNFGRK